MNYLQLINHYDVLEGTVSQIYKQLLKNNDYQID